MLYICDIKSGFYMENLQNLFNPLYTMTDKELAEKLGEYIKKRRIMMKLTQQELANKVGISRSQLVKIEKDGKTSTLTLIAIARAFSVLDPFLQTFETSQLTPKEEFELEEKRQKMIDKKPKRIYKVN